MSQRMEVWHTLPAIPKTLSIFRLYCDVRWRIAVQLVTDAQHKVLVAAGGHSCLVTGWVPRDMMDGAVESIDRCGDRIIFKRLATAQVAGGDSYARNALALILHSTLCQDSLGS